MVAAVLVTLAILAGFLAWRVAQGPVSLGFLAPYVSEALALPQLNIRAEIGDVVLAWSERDQSLRLRLSDVRYRAEDERVAMQVPNIDMSLSGPALLRGVIAPRYLHASGIEARIVRDNEGRLLIGLPDSGGEVAEPDDAAPPDSPDDIMQSLFASAFGLLSRDAGTPEAFRELETVSILTERLVLEDWKLGQRWVVPGVQIVLQRGEGHVFATASGTLDWRERNIDLKVDADYDAASRSARVVLQFENIEPSDFADVVPELAPLGYVHAPLSGSLTLTVTEDGRQLDLGFDLVAGQGSVVAPELFIVPLELAEASFKGMVDAAGGMLRVEEVSLHFADQFRLSFSGMILQASRSRFGLDVEGQLFDLPADALPHYWPAGMAEGARSWVRDHIASGKVSAGRFKAALTPDMLSGKVPVPRDAVRLDFAYEGLQLDYLAPMTKMTDAKGVAVLDAEELDLALESGKVGPLQVGPGQVRVLGLQAEQQQTDISGRTQGRASDILALIDQKPLGFPSKLGIRPAGVGGTGTVNFRLRFPLVNSLKVDDIAVNAEADLAGLSIGGLMNRYDLSQGDMKLKVDTKGLEASGSAAVNGVPLQIGWRQGFNAKAAVQARYSLKGRVDEAQRAALGYPLAPYVDGPVEASIDIEERRGGETAIGAEFDLTAATLQIDEAHFTKPAGQAVKGRVQARLKTGQATQIDLIELNGPELAARGKAVLPAGGGWAAEIAQFRNGDSDAAGRIVFTAGGDAQIELRGRRYDLRPFIGDAFDAGDGAPDGKNPRLVIDLRLDEAVVDDGLEMRNVVLSVRREPTRLEHVSLTGGFATTGGVTATLAPALNGRKLELRSDNAGAMLHFLGITDMQGGSMRIDGVFDDTKPNQPLAGRMQLRDVRAVRAPFLARLFGAGSFTGLGALLSGEGILFERGDVPFEQKDGVLTLKPSRLQGPQLGITLEGTVNQKTDHINVSGTAVPAFVLNTILGKIPVLGDIFVGEGIIGVNFAVSGARDDPQFTINPLSALAPGFLRRIFQAPQETAPEAESGGSGEASRPKVPEPPPTAP